jgi:hypothetical protein
MKTYKGMEVLLYAFSASLLHKGEWPSSSPGHFIPEGKSPPLPNGEEAEWIPEPVWKQQRRENLLPLLVI